MNLKIHNPYDADGVQCGSCWKYYLWNQMNEGSCGIKMCDECVGRDYVHEYRKLHGLIPPEGWAA